MKVSVSSYSFSQLFPSGELNQLSCISKAKEMGFDAIEFSDVVAHDGRSVPQYAKALADEAKKVGIPIINLSIGADFINGSDGNTQNEIERVKAMIDIGAILGVHCMRHDATSGFNSEAARYKGFDAALEIIAPAIREVSLYAKTKGIKTTVENHGFFCQDALRVEKLINAVACDNFGWLVDIGNFLCADETPQISVGIAAPYAFHVHAKDFHIKSASGQNPGKGFFETRNGTFLRGAIVGHGNVDVKNCLKALKKTGYDGYVSIEFEGIENPILALEIGLENLKRYISEI